VLMAAIHGHCAERPALELHGRNSYSTNSDHQSRANGARQKLCSLLGLQQMWIASVACFRAIRVESGALRFAAAVAATGNEHDYHLS
jgi:hypothetical protein